MDIKRKVIAVLLIVAVLGTGCWFAWGRDDAVAVVNGQTISRSELASRVNDFLEQYAGYGVEVTEEILAGVNQSALDELIAEVLLVQAAEDAGISISDEDVDLYFNWIAADYGGEDGLRDILRDMGYTETGFRAEVARQLAIQRYVDTYIEENVDPTELAVSEAEIQELYDNYAANMDDIPPLDEVRDYLEDELRNVKLQELEILGRIISELRDGADIKLL